MKRDRRAESRNSSHPERGSVILVALLLILGLFATVAVSMQLTINTSIEVDHQEQNVVAREMARSAMSQAIAKIKQGGFETPFSGTGSGPSWHPFGNGDIYYESSYDQIWDAHVIRAWGRVPVDDTVSGSVVSPDSPSYDNQGYRLIGYEVAVTGIRYIPEGPAYFGNGGVERPMGGFEWSQSVDPADPSTWTTVVSSNPASWQESTVPFQVSSLDHPIDYLENGGTPTPVWGSHPYSLWVSQTEIGQFNINAWFDNSAGAGSDPTTGLTPNPNTTTFSVLDGALDEAFPVDPGIADVQDFSWVLWNEYGEDSGAVTSGYDGSAGTVNHFNQGNHSGEFGTLALPSVTFVTGKLTVPAGQSFTGSGILVIRDDYDPNTDTNNTPSVRASLDIKGTLEWTGLVVLAGWAPSVNVAAGGDATILGAFFGEDSVQSGGETSLDSATIILTIRDNFRLLYSRDLFTEGGMVYRWLPPVTKRVVGIREIQ